jgi:hypothetical protein
LAEKKLLAMLPSRRRQGFLFAAVFSVFIRKKISFLTQQLQEHLAQGYPLPNFAEKPIPAGVPITAVLEFLANECLKIRLSMNASRLSKSTTKADTEAGE